MNVAYFIYVGKYVKDDMFDVCVRSLKKQSDCKIVVYTCDLENQDILKNRNVEIINFSKEDWNNRRMTCKIEKAYQVIKDMSLKDGDNVLSLDADLIFLKDPFDVFNNEFDFFYTTRHFESEFKNNGGVWGYKINNSSKKFMEIYINEINNPKWIPYIEFRKNHPHNRDLKNLDWWIDQDFICVCDRYINEINNGNFGFDITLFDAKSSYNYIIRNGYEEVKKEINSKNNYILHLKGGTFNRWGSSDTDKKKKKERSAYGSYFKEWLGDN
ncbi:hypothetical protein CL614_08265 [archaeon]|nr:hypothetical protein [archaeon]